MKKLIGLFLLAGLTWDGASVPARAADTKIVLIAGRPSHGPGEHEFNAGIQLLIKCLREVPGVDPVFVAGGWPEDDHVFDDAKSVVFFMDGGGGHPMIQKHRLETMRKLMNQGVGLVCLHYAVEFPKGQAGDQLLDWLGGYYETGYSDNPHNIADVSPQGGSPDHPRGQALPRQRRVVLQDPVPARRPPRHADPGRQEPASATTRRPTPTRSSAGRPSVKTAAAPSASPAATSTGTGASPSSGPSS